MKTIKFLHVIILFLAVTNLSAQTVKENAASDVSEKVEAYYFHFSSRCVTCRTVEAEAKADIESLYPVQVKQGLISFRAINLDEDSGKEIAAKLNVSAQSLLIVRGDQKFNITNEGFMYARSNPEKFKAIIKEKIDGLL